MKKISIKREQSQVGLSFAEREKFRPQVKIKLLLLLVLLMTAATGAWADSFSADAYAANATLNGVSVTANQTVTINEGVTVTVNNGLSIQSNATLTVTGGGTLVVNGNNGANGEDSHLGVDPDMGEEVWVNATPGGNGNSGIVIDNGGNLIISNATIIAVGGKGGLGGKDGDEGFAANGADGNGFASFPTIDGAVLSHSTNGTDYTEYASGDKTLYRYMKAVTAAPPTYSITLDEGTGNKDSQNWEITPQSSELSGGEAVTVKYNGSREVKSVTVVKVAKGGAVDNTYIKWDADQKKLVATPMPESFTTVENANDFVEWSAGTYVVEGNVTINGMIRLNGNVDLIIKDGAKLTVNSCINGDFNNLSIYGQAQKTGQLVVNCSDYQAITDLSTLEVHSAEVTATASGNNKHGGISTDKFNVYGGLVDAKTTAADGGYGISLSGGGSMDIYGGEVKAEGKGTGDWDCGIVCGSFDKAPVTVHGGKLWAGNADNKALNYITLTIDKSPSFNVEIETSSDNSTWNPTVGTPDSKYVRVGY